MRRLLIACITLVIIVMVCGWSVIQVGQLRDRMQADITAITDAIVAEDYDEVVWRVGQLTQYWEQEERHLMHIIRHAQIDNITLGVSRLTAMAVYQNTPDLMAELASISWQVSHIWESEQPSLKNMF